MDWAKIGPRIRANRERLGLSQTDYAKRLGLKQPQISQVERGEVKRPTEKLVTALRSVLGDLGNDSNDGARPLASAIANTVELLDITRHVEREFGDLLASIPPERKKDIVRHLKSQVSLLADLARDALDAAASAPAPDKVRGRRSPA